MGIKMKKARFVFLILFFVISSLLNSWAQSDDFQRAYLNGKELFRLEKYKLAMDAFEPATTQAQGNPFAEYASFYYALAAYRSDNLYKSKSMFLQILEKFSGWEKIEEVRYWLANIYYQENQHELALQQLNKITNDKLQKEAAEMSLHFLSQIESLTMLKPLLEKFPENRSIAKAIADKLNEQPIITRDIKYLDELIKKYDLKDLYSLAAPTNSIKKDKYKIAVLLPFMYDQFKSSNEKKNFVIEIYEGIKLALKDVEANGVNIEVFAYDTQRSAAATKTVLQKDEMKGMDLIIGPLYSEPIELVTKFAYDNKINMVNPVSTNGKVVANNPYSFLLLPSEETQGLRAAQFAYKELMGDGKRVLIFHGPSDADSILAYNYRNTLNKIADRSARVREVRRNDAKSMFSFLLAKRTYKGMEGEEKFEIPADSLSHIFVASVTDEGMIAANLISALERRRGAIKVIGLYNWIDYSFIVPEQLDRLEVNLLAPSFIDHNAKNYKEFRQSYLQEYHTLPSKFSALGYETLWLFSQLLDQHGNYFQVALKEKDFMPGYLLPGFIYKDSNDNQYLPVVRYKDAELTNVNEVKNIEDEY